MEPGVDYDGRVHNLEEPCPLRPVEQTCKILDEFTPQDDSLMDEMYSVLAGELGFSKICMLEVNHCQQSYAALLLTNNELSN